MANNIISSFINKMNNKSHQWMQKRPCHMMLEIGPRHQWMQKRPCHMMLEIGLSLRQTQQYGEVIQVNGIKTLP
jgi:hypothetical protein